MEHYDLCVIGSGPAGQKAAVQAAKLGKRVCIIEKQQVLGGAAINTGTIPSKSLREAILHLTGFKHRGLMGESYQVKQKITIEDLIFWCQQVIKAEIEIVRAQLQRNGVEIVSGLGVFQSADWVLAVNGADVKAINAEHVLISTGTRPARPSDIPFDQHHIVDADGILKLPFLPRTLMVVGGGVIGTEYASMMQALGVKVTLVEGRNRLMEFLDAEIGEALQYQLRQNGMTLRMGEKVVKVELIDAPEGAASRDGKLVQATLESGKTLRAECLLYCVGRQGNTEDLELEKVGVIYDDRGRIKVTPTYQTNVPTIYAAGDVIGFPALASTSMEQGRLAACHMFGKKTKSVPELFPYGIYAIPEISMVGWTEDKLTAEGIPFETGVANYREIARGQLLGDTAGMLKLLIHQETRAILGVHCIGNGATEIVHIGQAVMSLKGTVDYFVETVFNYPTLAECYKVAALNGVNKLAHV
ncbi:MAG: Si-specific NAD(P)(+) transhydrogenase [Planctomycetota bacterium]|nr:Si-specific NAD(P)(+) transhydrogenase [Planctomycetota bacterium]